MARIQELNRVQRIMLHTLNWMENTQNNVFVLNIDWDSGALTLYGHADDTSQFRNKFINMIKEVI